MSENPPLDARTILLQAAQAMKKRGWCQGSLYGNNGEVCLLGAVDVIIQRIPSGTPGFPEAAERALQDLGVAVKAEMNDHVCTVSQWNDVVCLSEEQAIAMLERAAGVDD